MSKFTIEAFKKRFFPLNQRELADMVGTSEVMVSNWLAGRNKIRRVYWLATCRSNIIEYIKTHPHIKERLFAEAQYSQEAMDLVKEIF